MVVVVVVVVVDVIVRLQTCACCLYGWCWFGCPCRDDRGHGSCWLFESAAHKVAFHGVPLQAVLCRGERSRVVRDIVVVSENFQTIKPNTCPFLQGLENRVQIKRPITGPQVGHSRPIKHQHLIFSGSKLVKKVLPKNDTAYDGLRPYYLLAPATNKSPCRPAARSALLAHCHE